MTPLAVTNNTFAAEVLDCKQPALVDFWAAWCGPCKMIAPIVDDLCASRPDIKVCKVNVDEEMELARQFRIFSIPTLIVIRDGKEESKMTGLRGKDQILSRL